MTDTVAVHVEPRSFPAEDPRATRHGQPLAYTFELTATHGVGGPRVTQFAQDAVLIWQLDAATLAAAGVSGFPLHVYTYNESAGEWEEVLSRWDPTTNQLVATTPHFSLYSVGSGFDVVNNYVPTLNDFELDLQSGAASVNYPINLPPGPGGFTPKLTLNYSSANVDRVDGSQQGPSPIGWGWNLSTSYIAATQHHAGDYHPWTASIVSDGANGDLVLGTDGTWHTAGESFTKVVYHAGSDHTNDWWDAWDNAGTHYVYNLQTRLQPALPTPVVWTTNRWMLSTVTDIHGNGATYNYYFEDQSGNLLAAPIPTVSGYTRAVYPHQITYGAGGNALQVTFNVVDRTINNTIDISPNDQGAPGLYQRKRIDRIDVQRVQPASGQPALLRSYDFVQDYSVVISTTGTPFPHLTLTGINPRGNDGTTQLPRVVYQYDTGSLSVYDTGRLWRAGNGYGGVVQYYYDAAGGGLNQAYRRVRAKRVYDGLGTAPPHNVAYYYSYRGAVENSRSQSAEANGTPPLHSPSTQFWGYGWAQEQDPLGNVTDHYYSQDDTYKGQEWRVQTGKAVTMTESMNAPPASNSLWTVTGDVLGATDPAPTPSTTPTPTPNGVWRVGQVGASVTRNGGVQDGADVSIRFQVNPNGSPAGPYQGTFKLENPADPTQYWGLQLYTRPDGNGAYLLEPKLVWGLTSTTTGMRDLSNVAGLFPHLSRALSYGIWFRLRLHTSPDGRFALELYRDAPNADNGDYLQFKSGDAGDTGGALPAFPTGQRWRFTYGVSQNPNIYHLVLLDDYAETRTLYAQNDTVLSNPVPVSAAGHVTATYVGVGNNCHNMMIRWVRPSEQWTASYGDWTYQPDLVKRTRTTYSYDTYGHRIVTYEYGDVDSSGDERSTHAGYAVNTSLWILDKLGWTKTYDTIMADVDGPHLIAAMRYYYDYQGSYNYIPNNGHGDLTQITHRWILQGATGTDSSQQFVYDSYGNQTQVMDPNNQTTTTTYDSYYHSFPVQVSYPNTSHVDTHYDYTLDVPDVITDVNGTVTHHSYDKFGRPGTTWTDGFGMPTNPNERYSFADLGQVTVTVPFSISYQQLVTGTTTTWATRWFDGRGRTVEDVTPKDGSNSIVVNLTYTDTGVISSTTLPYTVPGNNPASYITPLANQPQIVKYYDGAGRPSRVVNADNTYEQYLYTALQWVGTVDESGHQQWQHTDMLGRLDQVQESDPNYAPNLVYTSYTYDLLDHLTATTRDAGGTNSTVSTITYDGLGRKSEMTDADMGHWKYYYDLAGNLTRQEDALYLAGGHNDHQIFFTYDAMNRVTAKYYGAAHYGANIADVKYYYDNALGDAASKKSWGRLRLAEVTVQGQGADNANGHGYEYDARGLLVADVVTTTLSSRTNYTTGYSYDVGGRLTTLTYPDPMTPHEQVSVHYNSQGAGLPDQLTSSLGGPYPVYGATYNARGQLLTLDQGSGPAVTNWLHTAYTYDDLTTKRGWLTKTQVTSKDSSGFDVERLNWNLTYYANGNIEWVNQSATDANNLSFSNHFQYDGLDRMRVMTSTNTTVFPSEQTAFDSLGRMTLRTLGGVGYSVSYGDNAHKDAPTGYLTNSYSYDAAGSQITRTVGGATQSRNFDAENRLAQISAGGVVSAYIYDANGQRLIKSVSTGDTTQRTLYIGSLYEEDLSSKEPPYINYYQLGGKLVGMRRANQAASNGQYRLVSEQLGSTTLVVDTSTPSQVVQRQYHKPYGEVAWQYQASGSLTSINFTGQRLDSDSGLLYYGARFYDPVLSHFLSADTIIPDEVNPQALNRYSYVLNNPLKNVDPTGHCKEDASDIDQLDCTADDFDAMTADERIQWVKKFMELGRYGDVFKSIVGIIEYFRDSGIIDFTPGKSWTSLADAAILAAIQDGQRLSQGRTGLLTDPKARSAATKWSTFLKYYQQHDRDLDETSRELFNAAELAGEDFGTSYADKNRTHPVGLEGAVIDTFTQGGNVYRNANIYGVAAPSGFIGAGAVGAAGAYALTDPRCENCVYYGAFAIQAAVVLGWTVCVVCR